MTAPARRAFSRRGALRGGLAAAGGLALAGSSLAPANAQADGCPPAALPAADAHIRLAAPASNNDVHLLRRGFSFTDGVDPRTGELDAGLFFICFQQDPRTAFIPIQRCLAANDALNEYIDHVGSAIFACPPGAARDGFIADRLFAALPA